MTTKTNIFLTGATGYIGGSVLSRLLEHPDARSFNFTAIVRSPEKAEKLKSLGVHASVGSYSDLDLLEKLASEADVVFAIADADDLNGAKAILKGLKKRHQATGRVPILIHTSGTGVLADDARGMYHYDVIWDDSNPDQLDTIASTQYHRNVDLELLGADKEGYVKTYIVLPSTIWGVPKGKLVDLGIQNTYSIQMPALIDASLQRRAGGVVGEGKNIWPHVNIEEVADLYINLYNSIKANPKTGHGREGLYFGENGEYNMIEVAKIVSQALYDMGKADKPEPVPFTKEEIDKYFQGSAYLGSNSRCTGKRSRSIGWKPVLGTKEFYASLRPDVEAVSQRGPVKLR